MQSTSSPDYKALYEQSQLRIVALEQQLQQLQKMIFGSRHERFVPVDKNHPQLSLEITADPVATGTITSTQKISYTRNTVAIENKPVQHPGRMKLPESLGREEVIIEPEDENKPIKILTD